MGLQSSYSTGPWFSPLWLQVWTPNWKPCMYSGGEKMHRLPLTSLFEGGYISLGSNDFEEYSTCSKMGVSSTFAHWENQKPNKRPHNWTHRFNLQSGFVNPAHSNRPNVGYQFCWDSAVLRDCFGCCTLWLFEGSNVQDTYVPWFPKKWRFPKEKDLFLGSPYPVFQPRPP